MLSLITRFMQQQLCVCLCFTHSHTHRHTDKHTRTHSFGTAGTRFYDYDNDNSLKLSDSFCCLFFVCATTAKCVGHTCCRLPKWQERGKGGETGAHLELDTQTIQAENCLTQLLHDWGTVSSPLPPPPLFFVLVIFHAKNETKSKQRGSRQQAAGSWGCQQQQQQQQKAP